MTATFPKTDGDTLNADDINALPPIGSVMAWLKSLTGCPALSENWVECNGQVLSDAESPFDGMTIPDLNANGGGSKRFLRGSTSSGTTGGSVTPSGTTGGPSGTVLCGSTLAPSAASDGHTHTVSITDGQPPYYEVVWIIKIK